MARPRPGRRWTPPNNRENRRRASIQARQRMIHHETGESQPIAFQFSYLAVLACGALPGLGVVRKLWVARGFLGNPGDVGFRRVRVARLSAGCRGRGFAEVAGCAPCCRILSWMGVFLAVPVSRFCRHPADTTASRARRNSTCRNARPQGHPRGISRRSHLLTTFLEPGLLDRQPLNTVES